MNVKIRLPVDIFYRIVEILSLNPGKFQHSMTQEGLTEKFNYKGRRVPVPDRSNMELENGVRSSSPDYLLKYSVID